MRHWFCEEKSASKSLIYLKVNAVFDAEVQWATKFQWMHRRLYDLLALSCATALHYSIFQVGVSQREHRGKDWNIRDAYHFSIASMRIRIFLNAWNTHFLFPHPRYIDRWLQARQHKMYQDGTSQKGYAHQDWHNHPECRSQHSRCRAAQQSSSSVLQFHRLGDRLVKPGCVLCGRQHQGTHRQHTPQDGGRGKTSLFGCTLKKVYIVDNNIFHHLQPFALVLLQYVPCLAAVCRWECCNLCTQEVGSYSPGSRYVR